MIRYFVAVIASLVVMGEIAPPALAQQSPISEMQMQLLLGMLNNSNKQAAVSPRAIVNRSAKVKFVITINKKSAFSLPLRCTAGITHQTTTLFFIETKSVRATFNGNTGTCTIIMPFKWTGADDTRPVRPQMFVTFDTRITTVDATEAARPLRTTQTNSQEFPLPAEGTLTTISYNIDM